MTTITRAVNAEVATQSGLFRRKETLIVVLGGVLQILQLTTSVDMGAPWWVPAILAGVIATIQALITALTKSAITPSMADRLERRAAETEAISAGGVIDHIRRAAEA